MKIEEEAKVKSEKEPTQPERNCLCCRHPGRALVFVNAVSALRRVVALLKLLGVPAVALHAQQQQRQRLKVCTFTRSLHAQQPRLTVRREDRCIMCGGLEVVPCPAAKAIQCCFASTSLHCLESSEEAACALYSSPNNLLALNPSLNPKTSTFSQYAECCAAVQALDRFRRESNGVLVATDVAARGLDVKDIRWESPLLKVDQWDNGKGVPGKARCIGRRIGGALAGALAGALLVCVLCMLPVMLINNMESSACLESYSVHLPATNAPEGHAFWSEYCAQISGAQD